MHRLYTEDELKAGGKDFIVECWEDSKTFSRAETVSHVVGNRFAYLCQPHSAAGIVPKAD